MTITSTRARRRARTSLAWALVAAATLLPGGCRGPGSGETRGAAGGERASSEASAAQPLDGAPFNVVVLTLDTTRADHIGVYGAADAETPVLDALAASGVLFRNAYSPVPLTLPAHVSLFTGMYPFDHGVRDNTGYAVPAELTTLAEVLRDRGYATAAFVASYVLAPRWGLDQGFDVYEDGLGLEARRAEVMNEAQRSADEVVDEALAWLAASAEAPFLLWVHLYDPHVPYAPPEPYRSRFSTDPYAGEIAFMDAQLGRLVDALAGARDGTVIVVAGDHGEGLGEHDELEHGFFVYEEATRVPLLFALPGGDFRGIEEEAVVSLIDIMPTLLEINGFAIPTDSRGRSLLAPRAGGDGTAAPAVAVVYSETWYPRLHYGWSELTAVQDRRYKLIVSPEPELYDLLEDPDESANRINDERAVYQRLREASDSLLGAARERDARVPIDAEARRTLEALGYVAGPGAAGDDRRAAPRSKIDVYNRSLQARVLLGRGELDAAARLYDEILAEDPEVLIAYERLGEIYMLQGRHAEAAETLSFAIPLRPDWYEVHNKLAEAQIAAGDIAAAGRTLRGALDLAPPNPATFCLLGYVSELQDDHAAARRHYLDCQRLDAASPETLAYLARAELRLGDLDAAESRARAALALEPAASGPHFVLAQVHSRRGRPDLALAAYEAEVRNTPAHVEAHFGLAMLHGEAGRGAAEQHHLEQILATDPEHALAGLFLANILLQRGQDLQRAVDLATAAVEEPLAREDLAAGYFILSNLHARLGNAELAAQFLRRAESLR